MGAERRSRGACGCARVPRRIVQTTTNRIAPGTSMTARGGIDLGGTKIQTVVVNGRGSVIGDARHPTPTKGGPPAVAAEMATALAEAAEAAGVETSSLESVGVGSP